MILQALAAYYQRMAAADDSDIAPLGFEKKEMPFLIVLQPDGTVVDLVDTRTGEGKSKRGRACIVPKGVKKTSGIAANLLWDTPNYVAGVPKPDPQKDPDELESRARKQLEAFVQKIIDTLPGQLDDEGIRAVLAFCAGEKSTLVAHPLWPALVESGANVTFQLHGDPGLVCQRPAVVAALTSAPGDGEASATGLRCLVTGEVDTPTRLHTAIKGVRGAQSSGANIVSFNLSAFRSYGKEQGLNAPVGERAEFAYTTALNMLLQRGSRQQMYVGDTTVVFWAAQPSMLEDIFADLFNEPAKENPEQQYAAIRSLYAAPQAGAPPLTDDPTCFYVLGLAPNAARIAVRFWRYLTVGELAHHIRQHFDDCAIVHAPHQPDYLSVFRLLVNTAALGKVDNIPPNLAGDVVQAILDGTPYPRSLLAAVVNRIRAEQATDEKQGNVTYPRAALLKALLTREARYYHHSEEEITMALDLTNTHMGYRLGRLFSVLERIQEEASPGINATIRDRFYGSASSTPVAAFPHLMKLKNHHLAKLEHRGRVVQLERLIGEILDGLAEFPAHLDLQHQGRFAVGYYHQRQSFYTKNPHTNEEAQ